MIPVCPSCGYKFGHDAPEGQVYKCIQCREFFRVGRKAGDTKGVESVAGGHDFVSKELVDRPPVNSTNTSAARSNDTAKKSHDCPHCNTKGVLLMSDGRCPSCKVMLYGSPDNMDPAQSLRGVKGWLNFFVILKMYIAPLWVVFLLATSGSGSQLDLPFLLRNYERHIFTLLMLVAEGIIVMRFIFVARNLRDCKPGAVSSAVTWLGVHCALTVLSMLSTIPKPTTFNQDEVQGACMMGALLVLVNFLWICYFYTSKRVRATYPDWARRMQQNTDEDKDAQYYKP